ncbi:hypothetical protein BJ138DRAFT_1204895 [Hygrophoropsis aurantiaca]|uniref:Uncharacterized protein n=1 Tax=Hygrophoropsis aurantiaca TaxID=72124 RepID=A0ACB8A6G5_9AGAM|nr:hypothetical protein BJ138DRAFT_1204895 [Hygrophoropsis aurantiaca]
MVGLVCGGSGCLRTFDSQRGLTKHRQFCSAYRGTARISTQKRQERARAAETAFQKAASSRSHNQVRLGRRTVMDLPQAYDSSPLLSVMMEDPISSIQQVTSSGADDSLVLSSVPQMEGLPPDYRASSPSPVTSEVPVARREEELDADRDRSLLALPIPQALEDASFDNATPAPVQPEAPAGQPNVIRKITLFVRGSVRTLVDQFGMWRHYFHRPSYEPDSFVPSDQLARSCPVVRREEPPEPNPTPPPHPFSSMSIYRLMQWMNSGSKLKSEGEVTRLVKEVLLADDFNLQDLEKFSCSKYLSILDKPTPETDDSDSTTVFPDNWKQSIVKIDIPSKAKASAGNETVSVEGFHHRPLVEVIRTAFSDVQARAFHLWPFKQYWNPSGQPSQRVFGELYSSDSWLTAHEELQKQPPEPGCYLERVIAGLMFFSDATHLATFGNAKAWPLYLFFGNLSKYARSSPNSGACHLVAFFPSLPDSIKDTILQLDKISKKGIRALQTHCRRELFQGCWDILLDEEFLRAYHHGIEICCWDGIFRRVFPRIFTYSADYPEKVLIAAMRDMGRCPCPRCLVSKQAMDRIGLLRDIQLRLTRTRQYVLQKVQEARRLIFQCAKAVDSIYVDRILGSESWVPTINMFAHKLSRFGLDPFRMLVVDFMHECELGTWKSLFSHLVRLLYALPNGEKVVGELDARFRKIPPFGRGTIRKFSTNTSEMKRLAARDFEDILQCALPIFEGLFPRQCDRLISTVLFRFAEWHALCKLRLHTEATLDRLDEVYILLSQKLRKFAKMCGEFRTTELPKEKAARLRKAAQTNPSASQTQQGPQTKTFNMRTYKFHAMGDYPGTIKFFGTTDSYSTQTGELAHRSLKAFYPLVSKKRAIKGLSKHEQRQRRLRQIDQSQPSTIATHNSLLGSTPDSGAGAQTNKHALPLHRNSPVNIHMVFKQYKNDPAAQGFLRNLRNHLYHRLVNTPLTEQDHEFSPSDRNKIIIRNNILFSGKTMRLRYTTYDLREESDFIRLNHQCDIVVPTGETHSGAHPFWYARVLGIYHADVRLLDESKDFRNLQFLWVRWLGIAHKHEASLRTCRLPKIGFVPSSDPAAFGFLDPNIVIRAAHLIPAFADGRCTHLLPPGKSLARFGDEEDDWMHFYVNIFADRDMFMRYAGQAPGHSQAYADSAMDVDPREVDNTQNVYEEGDMGGDGNESEDDAQLGDGEEDADEIKDEGQGDEDQSDDNETQSDGDENESEADESEADESEDDEGEDEIGIYEDEDNEGADSDDLSF